MVHPHLHVGQRFSRVLQARTLVFVFIAPFLGSRSAWVKEGWISWGFWLQVMSLQGGIRVGGPPGSLDLCFLVCWVCGFCFL